MAENQLENKIDSASLDSIGTKEEAKKEDSFASEETTEESGQEKGEETEKEKKRGLVSFIKEILVYLIVIVLCVTVVPKYVIQRTEVDGESMENTLDNYDNLLVEKLTYHFKSPSRFDIVTLYPNGRDEKEYYIKRIIGLPGENVQIAGSKIYINGKLLKESYGKEKVIESGGRAEGEGITLKEDEYFVMGDNRNNSIDSRFEVGPVKKENIDGHAVLRICSFGKKKDGTRGSVSFSKFGTID